MRRQAHITPVRKAMEHLQRLPGIGPKAAAQLAYHLVSCPPAYARDLADSLIHLVQDTRICTLCGALAEEDPCRICTDPGRVRTVVCVVEQPLDVVALERCGGHDGLYHVLGGVLSPLEGVGPEDLRIAQLFERLQTGDIEEVILATNPRPEGDVTALYLEEKMKARGVRVTRMARGLPIGTEVGHVDDETLAQALRARTAMD